MPGLILPDVTLLTASANTMTAYMTAMRTHFNGVSTKFTLKANGHTNDAFTLVPAAAGEDWEMNFRRTTSLLAQVLIDPLENVTAPGTTGVAPTLTDSSEASPEVQAFNVVGSGAEDVDFYVIEMDDAIFVLFLDGVGPTHTPRVMHAGRIYVPYFTDGVNGDHYADGLGILGYIPRFVNASLNGVGYMLSAQAIGRARSSQTTWHGTAADPHSSTLAIGRINAIERIRPLAPFSFLNVDTSIDSDVGFTRYICQRRIAVSPGTLFDAGVGKDAWVAINYTNVTTAFIFPWDRNVSPIF
jgi:hypothetical protein